MCSVYGFIPYNVNDFEEGAKLPDASKVRLPLAVACRVQLCRIRGVSATNCVATTR
jgi:hypothetical protein